MALAGPCVIQSGDPDFANRWLGVDTDVDPRIVNLRAVGQPADVWVVAPLVGPAINIRIIHQSSGLCLARHPQHPGVCVIEPGTLDPGEISRQVWALDQLAPGTYAVSSLVGDNALMTLGPDVQPEAFGVYALPGNPSNWIFAQPP